MCKESIEELKKEVVRQKNNRKEIEWKKLIDVNKDIVGWIEIKDTNINYPIMQDTEKLYYLNHTYKKKYNRNGSIFTLEKNILSQERTIIYGHNMNNKIMFSELGKYMNKNFFEKHKTINIYTEKQNYEAVVFSCYTINEDRERKNIEELNFNEEINYYKKMSNFNVSIEDVKKIIKLSTCSYINSNKSQRYYIVAKVLME